MRRLGTGTDPRTPQNLSRIGLTGAGGRFLDRPEGHEDAFEVPRLEQRKGADLDVAQLPAQARVEVALRRSPLLQRLRQRQRVRRQRASVAVVWSELSRPFLAREAPDLLEAAPDEGRGGVVEEQQTTVGIGQERREREIGDQVARLNEQQGLIRLRHRAGYARLDASQSSRRPSGGRSTYEGSSAAFERRHVTYG